MMGKMLFSTSELAKWLGVFHSTVRRWIESGEIKGTKVGRNYKITAEEAVRVLNSYGLPIPALLQEDNQPDAAVQRLSKTVEPRGDSILRKLLVVEDIEEPAVICRNEAILGANQAFAKLVGLSQADLIGLGLSTVVDDSKGLLDFARNRLRQPENPLSHYPIGLKGTQKTRGNAKVEVDWLDQTDGIFVLTMDLSIPEGVEPKDLSTGTG
jgi:excisionase family DNA binding protein